MRMALISRASSASSTSRGRREPVMLMGASSAYLYLLDYLDKQGKTYALAADSRVFDTGGFKSTRTDMTVDDLYAAFERVSA